MKSFDSHVLTRKAHSATKINPADRELSVGDHDYKTNTRTSCASASSYSNRDRAPNGRNSKNVFCDDMLDRFKHTESRKKLFLYASQVLGKLKKVTTEHNDSRKLYIVKNNEEHADANGSIQKLKVSFRKINFYYDLLKRLLEERCILLLKEESRSCVKQTRKLVSDLKYLYSHEIIKLTTMPIKSYNRFIDSTGISISILKQLFKKVNYICDLHSSLKNNYQNIINFFHVGFDMELNQMLLKINKFQNHLYSEMFYWTHKVLEIFILKLCLADPDSVSPEFVHDIVETCESFNSLFFDKKQINDSYLTNVYKDYFSYGMQSDYGSVLLDFILQYLSHFEAKVAAEKIIQYLIHECKNYEHSALKDKKNEKEKRDVHVTSSNTSDYYSASPTIIEEVPNSLYTSGNGTFNFESVFLSVIQRNQSLILKYLYSIICLDPSLTSKAKNDENYPDSATGNKGWNLPQSGSKNRSYVCLEEKYWKRFWGKVLSFILKLMLEVPCHQYGNAAVGVFLFWPHSYHRVVFKLLKFSIESKDISPSGINITRKVFLTLLIHTIQESWDKNMSSALSMIHGQCCVPIPVAENKARTRIGNALCSCLESLRNSLLNDFIKTDNLHIQMFYPFQVTVDCFVFLVNTKTRASVSSSDIASYLLISCSDCVYACKLLEESELFGILKRPQCHRFFPSNKQKISISKQLEALSGHISEAPVLMHKVVSDAVRSSCKYQFKKSHWRICNYNYSFECGMFSVNSLEEILNSFTNINEHIYNGIRILSAITPAVATSLFSVLQVIHKNLSLKKIQTIKKILSHFLKWLDELNIEECEREKLRENKCLKKLLCVIHILELSLAVKHSYVGRINNKVTPLIDATPEECMILTEEERLYWRMYRKNCFTQCF